MWRAGLFFARRKTFDCDISNNLSFFRGLKWRGTKKKCSRVHFSSCTSTHYQQHRAVHKHSALHVSMYVSLSLLSRFRHWAGRLLRSLQAVDVDSSIYVSNASQVSCVESIDACTVNSYSLNLYFLDSLKIQRKSSFWTIVKFWMDIKQWNCKFSKCKSLPSLPDLPP